jgi:hypothetical protein
MSQTPENLYETVMLRSKASEDQVAPDGTDLNGGMFSDSHKA